LVYTENDLLIVTIICKSDASIFDINNKNEKNIIKNNYCLYTGSIKINDVLNENINNINNNIKFLNMIQKRTFYDTLQSSCFLKNFCCLLINTNLIIFDILNLYSTNKNIQDLALNNIKLSEIMVSNSDENFKFDYCKILFEENFLEFGDDVVDDSSVNLNFKNNIINIKNNGYEYDFNKKIMLYVTFDSKIFVFKILFNI
jgi:hypothetical protein